MKYMMSWIKFVVMSIIIFIVVVFGISFIFIVVVLF